MDKATADPSPALVTTALVWDELDDDERLRLHAAAQQPGCDLTKKGLPPVALTLLAGEETCLHPLTVEAINALADLSKKDVALAAAYLFRIAEDGEV